MLKMLTLLETVTVYTSSIDMLLTLRAGVLCLHEVLEFLDAPRISIRGCVRPSIGPSVRWSHFCKKWQKWVKLTET